jgi:KaiC/GvpD/RAD55 family RecA-like ATPase
MPMQDEQKKLPRAPIGIEGIDEMLNGGVPVNGFYIVTGPTGSMKSTFSMHFIYYGALKYNEIGAYITLEERAEGLRAMSSNFGMDLEPLEKAGKLLVIDLTASRKLIPTEFSEKLEHFITFESLKKLLIKLNKKLDLKRVVIDSVTALAFPFENPNLFRISLFKFVEFLKDQKLTTILVSEVDETSQTLSRYGVEEWLADGIFRLGFENRGGEYKRWIFIRKMRYTRHDTEVHPVRASSQGMMVMREKYY